MSPPLSQFPDLCLLGMFKHISLTEVIRTVGLVCKNWARVQRDELKHRHLLVINCSEQTHNENYNPYGSELIEHVKREDGSPWMKVPSLDESQFNSLHTGHNSITGRFTDLVMNSMPNITHLAVEQLSYHVEPTVSFLEQMLLLMQHYSAQLVSLTLDYKLFEKYGISEKVRDKYFTKMVALFDLINQLQALRHLQLDIISFDQVFSEMLSQVKLSILPRLDTFTTRSDNKFLFDSLREYATDNVRLVCGTTFRFNEMPKLNPRVKFIRVGVGNFLFLSDYSEMHLFCSRFTSLQTLDLTMFGMPMTMLTRCQSQLSQLVHLKLYFKFIEVGQVAEIVQVPSVRLLAVDISFQYHSQCDQLHLGEIFPNIQVLSVYYFDVRCDNCEYNSAISFDTFEPNLRARIEHCMRLARQPFRRCANLHTVKLDAIGSLQELLPQGLITVDQL